MFSSSNTDLRLWGSDQDLSRRHGKYVSPHLRVKVLAVLYTSPPSASASSSSSSPASIHALVILARRRILSSIDGLFKPKPHKVKRKVVIPFGSPQEPEFDEEDG